MCIPANSLDNFFETIIFSNKAIIANVALAIITGIALGAIPGLNILGSFQFLHDFLYIPLVPFCTVALVGIVTKVTEYFTKDKTNTSITSQ